MEDKRKCNRLDSVAVCEVIVIKLLKGTDTADDPYRWVMQYWDMQGNFLFEIDTKVNPS